METLYVTITVHVRESRYKHDKPAGKAEVELKVLRPMLEHLDTVFPALLGAALARYDLEVAEAAIKEE